MWEERRENKVDQDVVDAVMSHKYTPTMKK